MWATTPGMQKQEPVLSGSTQTEQDLPREQEPVPPAVRREVSPLEGGEESVLPPEGTLRGIVRDNNGVPLEGALVSAYSEVHWGKAPAYARSARSRSDGSFEIVVPVPEADGYAYRLWARLEEHQPRHHESVLVQRGKVHAKLDFALLRKDSIQPGRFTLVVSVVDENGKPREKALVTVQRWNEGERSWQDWVREASKFCDAAGRATLLGTHLGKKRLIVDGRRVGGIYERRDWSVQKPGTYELRVVSPKGRKLSGHLRDLHGRNVPTFQLDAWQEGMGGTTCSGWVKRDGSFLIEGLRPGRVVLSGRQTEGSMPAPRQMEEGAEPEPAQLRFFSPFTTTAEAGQRGLELRVKELSDPRAHGLHDAELHGTVVDDKGKGIVVDGFDLRAVRIPDAVQDANAWRQELLAELVHQQVAQRAMFGPMPPESAAFHLAGLRPGRYVLLFEKWEHTPTLSRVLWLQPGQILSGLTLRVGPGYELRGRVVDAAGRPVAKALLLVTGTGERGRKKLTALAGALRQARDERATLPTRCVRSDADGGFVLERLPRGVPLLFHAMHESAGRASTGPLILSGARPPLTLRLR